MPSWNELHYTRAEEFLRLLGKAVSGGGSRGQSTAPFAPPAANAPAAPPAPLAPLAPKPDTPAPPPTAAPTAAAVFKKIPWGKK